jgi:PAS domain S-box-containing protein
MAKTELFAGINRTLIILSTVIVALIGLGTFGMVVLLRPLAGRVILHTDELESQIYEKTAALNTELSERKRAEKSLRDSEALYHSLVDTLPINILRKDLRGRVTYGNRGYCERMGRPLSELLGKTDYDLFPRENADKYLSDDEKVIRSGEMFEDIEEHHAGDGQKLYVHVLKAPVRNAKGDIVGTQVIFWDVTARKLAEEALEKTAAELARSNKELEQFAYVASHDLQEPLRMITSYTQLIAKRYKEQLDSDAKEFMHFAVDGATRMQKLIQGLLEYSRVGTRGKPFVQTRCDEILTSALANLKLAIDEAGAVVTRDPLPEIISDPVQLTQLFQNLIGNALKFRSKDAPRIHIAVERRARADAATLNVPPYEWIFRVSDNGIGIEPQYYERIFVIFQRLHTQDKYPGTGIGLAICKKIVERHGGRIWVESRPGEGTTFFFALPALD